MIVLVVLIPALVISKLTCGSGARGVRALLARPDARVRLPSMVQRLIASATVH
jgi:hypothetical protein